MVAKVLDDLVHVRLHCPDAGDGIVADNGSLESGMLDVVDLAEHVVCNLAINDRAAVLVEVGLEEKVPLANSNSTACYAMRDSMSYFFPLAVGAINNSGQFRIINVQEVGPQADDGAVFFVELLHPGGIVGRVGLPESPEVGPSY